MQDLMSRQLPLTAANRGAMPNLNDAWADIHRTQAAHSLPHSVFPSGWASEFKPAAFTPGPTIQQNVPPVNCASTVQFGSTIHPNSRCSDSKPTFDRKWLRDNGKSLRP